jgi:signal transduction histidine kinase
VKRTSWITWRIFFLALPIDVVVLIFAADHSLKSWRDVYMWGFVAVIAHLGLAPLAYLAIKQSEIRSRWKFDLACLLVLGAARGVLINSCVVWLNLTISVSGLYKVFNSTVALPQWFIGLALFVESRRIFQREFRSLFAQAIQKQLDARMNSKLLESYVSPKNESIAKLQIITSNLANDIQRLLERPKTLENYALEAEKIQKILNEDIRPTSSEIWKKSKVSTPKIDFRTLAAIVFFEKKLRVPLMLSISIPYLFIGLNGVFGLRVSVAQCVFISSLNLLIYGVFELFSRYTLIKRKTANINVITMSCVVPIFFQAFFLPKQFTLSDEVSYLLLYQAFLNAGFVGLLLLVNGYEMVTKYRAEVIAALAKQIDSAKFSQKFKSNLSDFENLEFAQYLHGEVQAELTASSLLLQQAAKSGDADLAQEALERASSLLNHDLESISHTRMAIPEERISRLVSAWKGIAEINVDLPEYDLINPRVMRELVQLIEESVANSVRHAKANKINIVGLLEGNNIKTVITSNGAPLIKGKSGLGTRLFNELCIEWSQKSENGFNHLTFYQSNQ